MIKDVASNIAHASEGVKAAEEQVGQTATVSGSIDPQESQTMRGEETVLLVEDDASVRSMTFNMLSHMGYEVLQARSGQEALSTMAEYVGSVDLLLTDLVMPGMNGRELSEGVLKQ